MLGFIFPLAPLFLLRGQAREKSGIEVDCIMMMMRMTMMMMMRMMMMMMRMMMMMTMMVLRRMMMMIVLKRVALLATSVRFFAALGARIFSSTRR